MKFWPPSHELEPEKNVPPDPDLVNCKFFGAVLIKVGGEALKAKLFPSPLKSFQFEPDPEYELELEASK